MTKESNERGKETKWQRSRKETNIVLSKIPLSPQTNREYVFEMVPYSNK